MMKLGAGVTFYFQMKMTAFLLTIRTDQGMGIIALEVDLDGMEEHFMVGDRNSLFL